MEIKSRRKQLVGFEPGSVVLVIKLSTHCFGALLFRNDPTLIGKIYGLFLGTFVSKDKEKSKNNPKPEHRRVPANTRLRLKLMPHLLKSREAALQVSQDSRQSFRGSENLIATGSKLIPLCRDVYFLIPLP